MGSLVCRIELHKQNGVIITVENEDSEIAQTVVMDGTAITTTCKGSDNTSTITQDQSSITIKCKEFTVDAETILCKSEKETTHESGKDYSLTSSAALSMESSDDLTASAGAKMELSSSDKLTASAGAKMELSGSSGIDVSSSTGDVELSGSNVKAAASIKASMEGVQVEFAGSGTAKLESDGMTTIGGSSVKIG